MHTINIYILIFCQKPPKPAEKLAHRLFFGVVAAMDLQSLAVFTTLETYLRRVST